MKKIILLFIFLLSISFVLSQGISKPHAFYGDVHYSDGTTLLEKGYSVTAKIDGVEVGKSDIINGEYDLVVEGEKGETIYFYVNEEKVETSVFEEFGITELDFFTDIAKPTSPENNNDDNDNGDSTRKSSSSSSSSTTQTNDNTIKLNIKTEDDENTNLISNENQETSPGITGAVIGFVKSGGGIGLIFTLLILGIGVMILRKRASKNAE